MRLRGFKLRLSACFHLAAHAYMKLSIQLRTSAHFIEFHGMGEGGFEPPKALLTDLQSAPFGHSGIPPDKKYLIIKADDRTRTDNLLITNQLLCQLSHIGTNPIQQLICNQPALPTIDLLRSSIVLN